MIAHEVGHHVQNLLGISGKVQDAQRRARTRGGERSCRCGSSCRPTASPACGRTRPQRQKQVLERGDIEEAMGAAAAVGDDRIQKQTQGYVVPESFTHGSAAQRARWFKRGFESGSINDCDTFSGGG